MKPIIKYVVMGIGLVVISIVSYHVGQYIAENSNKPDCTDVLEQLTDKIVPSYDYYIVLNGYCAGCTSTYINNLIKNDIDINKPIILIGDNSIDNINMFKAQVTDNVVIIDYTPTIPFNMYLYILRNNRPPKIVTNTDRMVKIIRRIHNENI